MFLPVESPVFDMLSILTPVFASFEDVDFIRSINYSDLIDMLFEDTATLSGILSNIVLTTAGIPSFIAIGLIKLPTLLFE